MGWVYGRMGIWAYGRMGYGMGYGIGMGLWAWGGDGVGLGWDGLLGDGIWAASIDATLCDNLGKIQQHPIFITFGNIPSW